ncbi:MAG: DUF5819 family protein [Halobacteriovoraceae bacterium]|nr:DUF5819 family protein [Halobacteriovoraceae bacterium]
MRKAFEKLFLGLIASAAIFHLLVTVLYLAPKNPLVSSSLNERVHRYMDPAFSQRWGFFSPRPGLEDVSFEYQCLDSRSDNRKNKWVDLSSHNLKRHQDNRLLGLGRILYLTKGLAEDFLKKYEISLKSCMQSEKKNCRSLVKKDLLMSREFHFANNIFLIKCPRERFKGYSFRLKVSKPIAYSRRDTQKVRSLSYLNYLKIPYTR